jgi:hypothetical protein
VRQHALYQCVHLMFCTNVYAGYSFVREDVLVNLNVFVYKSVDLEIDCNFKLLLERVVSVLTMSWIFASTGSVECAQPSDMHEMFARRTLRSLSLRTKGNASWQK